MLLPEVLLNNAPKYRWVKSPFSPTLSSLKYENWRNVISGWCYRLRQIYQTAAPLWEPVYISSKSRAGTVYASNKNKQDTIYACHLVLPYLQLRKHSIGCITLVTRLEFYSLELWRSIPRRWSEFQLCFCEAKDCLCIFIETCSSLPDSYWRSCGALGRHLAGAPLQYPAGQMRKHNGNLKCCYQLPLLSLQTENASAEKSALSRILFLFLFINIFRYNSSVVLNCFLLRET